MINLDIFMTLLALLSIKKKEIFFKTKKKGIFLGKKRGLDTTMFYRIVIISLLLLSIQFFSFGAHTCLIELGLVLTIAKKLTGLS